MSDSVVAEVKQLESLSLPELRTRWREITGEETNRRHRRNLIRQLARRIQEDHFGGIPPEVQAQVDGYRGELEKLPPERWFPGSRGGTGGAKPTRKPGHHDPRVPRPGTILTRNYRGEQISVTVLDDGFDFNGRPYRSLSAIAREVTGTPWNGYLFFSLGKKK